MANAAILKEYLVALGMQDNMTPQLRRTLRQSEASVKKFAGGVAKASLAMAGLLIAANAGVARFVTGLVQTDDRVNQLAEDLGKTHDEATKLHFALRTMGRSLEEIEASPELTRQFQQLQRDAERIKIPDMRASLEQVRGVQGEFMRLRNIASHGIQWIGHHLLKYLYQPMKRLREVFSGLNDRIIDGMPEWSRRIAGVMASVVRITTSIIRGAAAIFRVIRRIFDMIPTEIKILTGVLAAFAAFIRAGPVGKLMMLFTVLMLLVEDFFTYLDGGEALLGGLWRWLINLWETLNEGGGFIERLKAAFTMAMDAAVRAIRRVIDWVAELFQRMRDLGALENFRSAFASVGNAIGDIFRAVTNIFRVLFSGFRDGANTLQPFLAWLLGVALPGAIGLIADVVSGVANAVSWFFNLRHAREILIGVAAAIGGVIAAMKIYHAVMLVITKAKAAWKAIIVAIQLAKYVWAGQIKLLTGLSAGWMKLIKVLTVVKTIWAAVMKVATVVKAILLSPITLIIAAIAALVAIVVLVIRNWERIGTFFRNLWEQIKQIFGVIAGWFRGIFRRAAEAVMNAIRPIIAFFRGIWDGIVGIFSAVGGWFRDRFNQAVEGIKAVFSVIGDFFRGIWDGIVGIFSGVADFFRNIFSSAFEGITNIFSRITGFFSGLWDGVLNGVRAFVDRVLGFLRPVKNLVQGVGNFVGRIFGRGNNNNAADELPGHAEGCIFSKPHIAAFAEDGPEAVIPLSKPDRARDVLGGVMNFLDRGRKAIKGLDSGITGQAKSVSNYTTANTYNNYSISMPSSYNINDTSGRPESVAKAVERKEQLKMRNLQGIINAY